MSGPTRIHYWELAPSPLRVSRIRRFFIQRLLADDDGDNDTRPSKRPRSENYDNQPNRVDDMMDIDFNLFEIMDSLSEEISRTRTTQQEPDGIDYDNLWGVMDSMSKERELQNATTESPPVRNSSSSGSATMPQSVADTDDYTEVWNLMDQYGSTSSSDVTTSVTSSSERPSDAQPTSTSNLVEETLSESDMNSIYYAGITRFRLDFSQEIEMRQRQQLSDLLQDSHEEEALRKRLMYLAITEARYLGLDPQLFSHPERNVTRDTAGRRVFLFMRDSTNFRLVFHIVVSILNQLLTPDYAYFRTESRGENWQHAVFRRTDSAPPESRSQLNVILRYLPREGSTSVGFTIEDSVPVRFIDIMTILAEMFNLYIILPNNKDGTSK